MSNDKRKKLAELLADDKPGLRDDAARLAMAGRKGDKLVAHITPEEAALLKSRGGAGTINPRTGLLEFYDGSDPMGSGSDYGSTNDGLGGGYGGADPMGSGADYTPSAGWNAPDISGLGGADAPSYAAMPGEDRQIATNLGFALGPNQVAGAQSMGRFGAWAGGKLDQAQARPVETALNVLAGFIPGVGTLNTVSGLFNGPTIGGGLAAAGRAISGANNGTQFAGVSDSVKGQTTGALANGDSPDGPDMGGRGSGDGGPLGSGQAGGKNSPLASALLNETTVSDPWANMGRRKTFGALESSFSPYGREYVTPWAYRG